MKTAIEKYKTKQNQKTTKLASQTGMQFCCKSKTVRLKKANKKPNITEVTL